MFDEMIIVVGLYLLTGLWLVWEMIKSPVVPDDWDLDSHD
jgi:hypothetical protein